MNLLRKALVFFNIIMFFDTCINKGVESRGLTRRSTLFS